MSDEGVLLDWELGAIDALRRWPGDVPPLLLHSGRAHPRWARRSILASPVAWYRFEGDSPENGISRWEGDASLRPASPFTHRPFADLRAVLDAHPDALWIGYLSYDLGRWIEHLPSTTRHDRAWPIIELGLCPGFLSQDTASGRWSAHGAWATGGYPDLSRRSASNHACFEIDIPRSVVDRARFEEAVAKAIAYIGAGDIFQVNLSQRFSAGWSGSWPQGARSLFASLASVSPAWYGAYLELPGRAVASTSPELFLEVSPEGGVVTRPIKGTRPATIAPEVLLQSSKDAAELNMIVDLLRNDLGRVCSYGSVRVTQPRVIESHPTVHHGVATVEGRLHPSRDVVDLLRATMPGGSITGAPKIRAMQIIEELEPVRRGPYCGAVGFLSRRHGTCLNVAIRSMLLTRRGENEGVLDFSVGGGVVADSTPSEEYEETLHKAAAMLGALNESRSTTARG